MATPEASLERSPNVDWGLVWKQAVVIARKFVPEQDVDDLVTEGMKLVIEGSAPWDASGKRPLAGHVVQVGYNALRNEKRRVARRQEEGFVARLGETYEEQAQVTPEAVVSEAEQRERKARLLEQLAHECADHPDSRAVLECERAGVHEPAAQAARTGLGIEAVRNARKVIKRRALALVQAEGEDEEGRRS